MSRPDSDLIQLSSVSFSTMSHASIISAPCYWGWGTSRSMSSSVVSAGHQDPDTKSLGEDSKKKTSLPVSPGERGGDVRRPVHYGIGIELSSSKVIVCGNPVLWHCHEKHSKNTTANLSVWVWKWLNRWWEFRSEVSWLVIGYRRVGA